MSATVAIIGTCDTKLEELAFLRDEIKAFGNISTLLIDVGRSATSSDKIDVSASDIISKHGPGLDVSELSRGEYVKEMASCATKLVRDMCEKGSIHGIVSAGGSGGTSLASTVMRALPIGLPKMIVSTVASGDTAPIVGESDIALMYSVVDVSGLNHILRDILCNAGSAIAGAALSYVKRGAQSPAQPRTKKRVAITMFGVTTPGVDAIRHTLESHFPIETYVFHATGHGGRAMERLIRSGDIDAVVDLTTTEVCDLIMGGVMSAGDERLDAAIEAGIPNIISLGALDIANFGVKASVPERYHDRVQVEHNPIVTLVRSSPQDCRAIAEFICKKIKKTAHPELTQVWIPRGGTSMLSVPDGPFYDEDADASLYDTIKNGLEGTGIKVVEEKGNINSSDFASRVAEAIVRLMKL